MLGKSAFLAEQLILTTLRSTALTEAVPCMKPNACQISQQVVSGMAATPHLYSQSWKHHPYLKYPGCTFVCNCLSDNVRNWAKAVWITEDAVDCISQKVRILRCFSILNPNSSYRVIGCDSIHLHQNSKLDCRGEIHKYTSTPILWSARSISEVFCSDTSFLFAFRFWL